MKEPLIITDITYGNIPENADISGLTPQNLPWKYIPDPNNPDEVIAVIEFNAKDFERLWFNKKQRLPRKTKKMLKKRLAI